MARRKSGQGTVRLRKDGRWEGRIVIGYDENGLPKTKNVTAKTKTECIEKLEKLKDETGFIRREKVHSRMTFGEWMDFWYQNYCKIRIKESTQEGYETRIYNHIIPKIGKIPLNELTQNDLQKFYNCLKQDGRLRYRDTLGEGLSDRFVRSCHANCRTALQKATDDRLIKKNPAIGCKIPPKKSREMQVLTPDEIKRFLIQAKYDGFFEIFLVALSTGLRRGEDTALKWEDLNFDTGELKVRRQVKRTKGRLVITEPKTEESVRTIILPKSLVRVDNIEISKSHYERTDENDYPTKNILKHMEINRLLIERISVPSKNCGTEVYAYTYNCKNNHSVIVDFGRGDDTQYSVVNYHQRAKQENQSS